MEKNVKYFDAHKAFTLLTSCFYFFLNTCVSFALTPHEISLPIVNLTMDEDSFQLMETTHSKEIEPICQFSLTSDDLEDDINQTLKIQLSGCGSRWGALKSYELKANKKWGASSIPNEFLTTETAKFKALRLRTTTSISHKNYPYYTGLAHNMFMTIFGRNSISKIDYQESLQVVAYINGNYRGIYDLTETANMKYIKSKYGFHDDEVNFCKLTLIGDTIDWDHKDSEDSIAFMDMHQSILNAVTYDDITSVIDIDNLIDYYLFEIYSQNDDWITNNCIVWREKNNGKWRFILNDFDYTGLFVDKGLIGILGTQKLSNTFIKSVFQKMCRFQQFKSHFCDRMFIACATYLHENRIREMVDSLASNIRDEIPYQAEFFREICDIYNLPESEYDYFENWDYSIEELANWGYGRGNYLYSAMKSLLHERYDAIPLSIYSNNRYLFNGEWVREDYHGKYFPDRRISFTNNEGEFLPCIVHSIKNDGNITENSYTEPFTLPVDVTKAEIYLGDEANTSIQNIYSESTATDSKRYDLQGRVLANPNRHSIWVNSKGEKRMYRE